MNLFGTFVSLPVILIIVGIILIGMIIAKYNGMIRRQNILKQAFADIDVQLKQRFDLVPNLVETVKGYADHESETFRAVTEARTSFMNATTPEGKIAADGMLAGALKSLFAVSENYPDLKANQNFLSLQTELADIENKIAAVRRFYNSTVQEYNTYIQVFPNNIIASIFGFKEESSFEIEEATQREPVKVSF